MCPFCGEQLVDDRTDFRAFTFKNLAGKAVLQVSNLSYSLSAEPKLELEYKEQYAFVFNGKRVAMYQYTVGIKPATRTIKMYRGTLDISRGRLDTSYYCPATIFTQTPGEIMQELAGTVLEHSGIDYILENNITINNVADYMKAYVSQPGIELLLKAGLHNLMADAMCIRTSNVFLMTAGPLYKRLGITKQQVNDMQKNGDSTSILYCMRNYKDILPQMTVEEANFILSDGNGLPDICREYNIVFHVAREYLERCLNYQCIPINTAINIWSDYLRMATKLKYNLQDNKLKYPSSLKKEHDIATFAFNAIAEQIKAENFTKHMDDVRWLEYTGDEDDDYCVRVPDKAEDVVCEGKTLHHCVASYISRISDGETSVVFLRKKELPDQPFFTVEVQNRRIVQVHGMSNCNPYGSVTTFLRKWAKEKKLTKTGYSF